MREMHLALSDFIVPTKELGDSPDGKHNLPIFRNTSPKLFTGFDFRRGADTKRVKTS
jgi:hypothetical protein